MMGPFVTTFSCVKAARSCRFVNAYISARRFSTEKDFAAWVQPRQCIIDTDHPSHTAKTDVLQHLHNNFRLTKRTWFKFLKNTKIDSSRYDEAIVILATPTFAKWLEDDTTFLPKLLSTVVRYEKLKGEKVEQDMSLPTSPLPVFEVDVVCACVDGLPPRLDWIQSRDARYHREGLAFLHGPTHQIVPRVWEEKTQTSQDYAEVPSSITFSSYVSPENKRKFTELTLPLGNTLFVTGKPSSVSVSKWRFRPDQTYEKIKSTTKSHQVINVFGGKNRGFAPGHIPAIPLAPPRRIMSGLGNIIREISLDGENASPASRELEVTINQYMRATGQKESRVTVWALVTPSESMPSPPLKVALHSWADLDAVKEFWTKGRTDNTFIGAWLQRGATLCSILSGGGGWGPSQGLLSLDPQVTPGAVTPAPFPFPVPGEEQNELSLEGIVKPDKFVQFFLMPEQKEHQPTEVIETPGPDSLDTMQYSLTAFGTVPQALDNVQAPEWVASKSIESKDFTYFRGGHFGAVTESGLFLNSATVKDKQHQKMTRHLEWIPIKSKINAPFSYFYKNHEIKQEKKDKKAMDAMQRVAPVRRYNSDTIIRRVQTGDLP